VGIVAVIYLFTPTPTKDQDLPYLLEPVERFLDAKTRYKAPHSQDKKDWKSDLSTEQFIWRNELSKIMLGAPDAKPIEQKRDFLLYLGDSFFRDEPHFDESKAAYLTASATKRMPHINAYDYTDDELWRRIAYCDLRLGKYDEAEVWFKKALSLNEDAIKALPDLGIANKSSLPYTDLAIEYTKKGQQKFADQLVSLANSRNEIIANLAEVYCRKGQPQMAEELIKQRLKEMKQPNPDFCIEVNLLHDIALAKQGEGDLIKAEHFYKLAIKDCAAEDAKRGVVAPEGSNDNNRELARILKDYSHLLRQLHRNEEAIAAMRRSLLIYDNPPP
jgi:tetratricopeptide (TPR) repeat protein